MKHIVLIGATGFVGSALLTEALNRGHQVTALVRHPERITVDHPHLIVVKGDATIPETLASAATGKDAVVSAYNPGWANPHIYEDTLENYPKILDGVRRSGVKHLLIVGGAGTLFVKPGLRLMDTGTLAAEWMPGVKSLATFYLDTLMQVKDLDWVFLSPAANLTQGPHTGTYRTGKDDLLTDSEGNSTISVEDYAVAMMDELEQPHHHFERFTVGY